MTLAGGGTTSIRWMVWDMGGKGLVPLMLKSNLGFAWLRFFVRLLVRWMRMRIPLGMGF